MFVQARILLDSFATGRYRACEENMILTWFCSVVLFITLISILWVDLFSWRITKYKKRVKCGLNYNEKHE